MAPRSDGHRERERGAAAKRRQYSFFPSRNVWRWPHQFFFSFFFFFRFVPGFDRALWKGEGRRREGAAG